MMSDELRLPWDPLWEFVLSDFEDEDENSSVPAIETEQSSLPQKRNWNPLTFRNRGKKTRSRNPTAMQMDGRDDSDSARSARWHGQAREEGNGDPKVSLWDLLGPSFNPGEKARSAKIANRESSGALGIGRRESKQMKKDQDMDMASKRTDVVTRKSYKTHRVKEVKKTFQQEWDDNEFAPLIMVFDVMERFERLDPLGLNKTFSSDTESSNSRREVTGFGKLNSRRRVPSKKSSKDQPRSIARKKSGHRKTVQYDIAKSSGDKIGKILKKNRSFEYKSIPRKTNHESDIDFNATKSSLAIQLPTQDENLRNQTPDHSSNPLSTPKLGSFEEMEKVSSKFVHQLNAKDVEIFFPATRIVSDSNAQVSVGEKLDNVDGIMGIPPVKCLDTRGPQSLYVYEYSSKEHMDVSYSEYGEGSISSIVTRRLGLLPSLASPNSGKKVLVIVEASTVSTTDCYIRQGKWRSPGRPNDPLPVTPGVDIAGKVCSISHSDASHFSLYPGQSVMSLVKMGGNSRFISIDPENLIKVPDGIDPAQAACLAETYLAAFQMLHFELTGSRRYQDKSLKGKSVFVVGPMTNSYGKAIMELALNAGAAIVFATAKKKHWKKLIEIGIIPLDTDSSTWADRVEGIVDLILVPNEELVGRDMTSPNHRRALRDTGNLIVYGLCHKKQRTSSDQRQPKQQPSIVCKSIKASLTLQDQSHLYDVYEQWDKNLATCKKDLTHLLGMLERELIKPRVLDRIPLSKVAKAQALMESKKRLTGFLVCEPWMHMKKRTLCL
eukprot:scaffold1992_cov113-Cylindrotheca_fusiformis.AAC.10